MAAEIIRDAVITLGTFDFANAAKACTINYTYPTQDVTGFGDGAKRFLIDTPEWNVDIEYTDDFAALSVNSQLWNMKGTEQPFKAKQADRHHRPGQSRVPGQRPAAADPGPGGWCRAGAGRPADPAGQRDLIAGGRMSGNGHAQGESIAELRERILHGGRKLRIEPVETEYMGTVYVREFTGRDRDRAQEMTRRIDDAVIGPGWRGRLVALFMCAPDGSAVFDPIEHGDELNALPAIFLETIIDAGNKLNALSAAAIDQAKENFNDGPSDASTSDSPATSAA